MVNLLASVRHQFLRANVVWAKVTACYYMVRKGLHPFRMITIVSASYGVTHRIKGYS